MKLDETLERGIDVLSGLFAPEKGLFTVTLYLGVCAIAVQQHGIDIHDISPQKGFGKMTPDTDKWAAFFERKGQADPFEKLAPLIRKLDLAALTADELTGAFYRQAGRMKHLSITPPEINRLIAAALDLEHAAAVYDGTCGFGGSLLGLAGKNTDAVFYGQDINPESVALADLFLTLRRVRHRMALGDALLEPAFFEGTALKKFDCVVIDPPIGLKTARDPKEAAHGRFSPLDRKMGRLDFYFMLSAVERSRGKTAIVSGSGPLIRSVASEQKVRRYLLSQLTAVIRLPAGLYAASSARTHLLLFDRQKKNDRVLMIDAGRFSEGRLRDKKLSENGIQKILSVLRSPKNEDGFSRIVTHEEMKENGDSWNVEKYITEPIFQSKHFGAIRWNPEKLRLIKTVPVQDLCTLIKGYNLSAKNAEAEDGIKILRLNDIDSEGRIHLPSIAGFSVDGNLSRHKLQKGDVILVAKGTKQKIAVFESDEPVYLSINLMALRPKTIHPYFIKAYLESPLGEHYLADSLSGTVLPVLTAKNLGRLPVPEDLIARADAIGRYYERVRRDYFEKLDELQKDYWNRLIHLDKQMSPDLWEKN